jgi:hypothetical protein
MMLKDIAPRLAGPEAPPVPPLLPAIPPVPVDPPLVPPVAAPLEPAVLAFCPAAAFPLGDSDSLPHATVSKRIEASVPQVRMPKRLDLWGPHVNPIDE